MGGRGVKEGLILQGGRGGFKVIENITQKMSRYIYLKMN